MNNEAAVKITMIQSSRRCFAYGLAGLLPLIGLPFAVLALWNGGRARVRERKYWNAAKPYRVCGVICAALGMIAWGLIAAVIVYNALTGGWGSD